MSSNDLRKNGPLARVSADQIQERLLDMESRELVEYYGFDTGANLPAFSITKKGSKYLSAS